MPEEVEIETKELQETLEELQEERKEREESERKSAWTRYIALTTAIMAVFAAIAALQSGTLVNEAMMKQLKASDKWNEYQASRQKDHMYTLQANGLLDAGAQPPSEAGEGAAPERGHGAAKEGGPGKQGQEEGSGTSATAAAGGGGTGETARESGSKENSEKAHGHGMSESKGSGDKESGGKESGGKESGGKEGGKPSGAKPRTWKRLAPSERLAKYLDQVKKESEKEEGLQEQAKGLEEESEELMHHHHRFAQSVAFIQVAIALAAVAALTRTKPVWAVSMVVGLIGIALTVMGLLPH